MSHLGKGVRTIYFNSKTKLFKQQLIMQNTNRIKMTVNSMLLPGDRESSPQGLFLEINKGILHIGYLPASIRMKIEKLFHDRKIVAMFCTVRLLKS